MRTSKSRAFHACSGAVWQWRRLCTNPMKMKMSRMTGGFFFLLVCFLQADWRLFESKPYSFVWLRFKHTHRAPWDALFCNAAEMEQVEFESPWKLCRTLLGLSAPLACFPFVYGLVQERLRLMSCFSQKEPHNDSCLPLIRSSKENELPVHRYSSVKK